MSINVAEVSLDIPDFGYLESAELTMNRVPVIGGAIQVDLPEEVRDALGDDNRAKLGLTIVKGESLTVSRIDQMAQFTIQAMNHAGMRHEILREPVPMLRFTQSNSDLWSVDVPHANKAPRIVDEVGLGRFVSRLTSVAVNIQNSPRKPGIPLDTV